MTPASAVVPNVPSVMCRPARPAICPISALVKGDTRPSNLRRPAKSHTMDIHVEAHADCIGRHKIVHLARLIEFDLRRCCGGLRGAHDDGGAAALAANEFGDGVDIRSGEGDHGGTGGRRVIFFVPVWVKVEKRAAE